MKTVQWCVLAALVSLFLAGCGGDDEVAASGSDARRLWQQPPASVSVTVPPSPSSQTLSLAGLGVTIPGGLLATTETLKVTPLSDSNITRPSEDMQTLGVYDIKLGSTSDFAKPLVLEFPYDAAAIGGDALEGKNLWAAYWEETRQVWARMEVQVDTARQKIVVTTGHLSTWWIYRLKGYDYVPKNRTTYFEVYFNPNHVNPRTDIGGQSMQGLAEDVLSALETARENYKSAGFKVPSVTTSVFIADVADSNWGALGGAIDLKRKDLASINDIKNDSAHELFHAVQNQYYYTGLRGVGGMSGRLWLIEGTPDFMAYRYAWNRSIPRKIDNENKLDLAWFADSPFENRTDVDAYKFGNFLQYLEEVENVDVKQLWDYVVAWWMNTPGGFRDSVMKQVNESFDTVWDRFVEESMFGAARLANGPTQIITLDRTTETESKEFVLKPGYTAVLVMARISSCDGSSKRKVRVSSGTDLAAASGIRLWTGTPGADDPRFVQTLTKAGEETGDLLLDESTFLFAVAYNNNKTAPAPVRLTASADKCQVQPYNWSQEYRTIVLLGNNPIEADASMGIVGPTGSGFRATYVTGVSNYYNLEFGRSSTSMPTQVSVSASPTALNAGWTSWESVGQAQCQVSWSLDSLGCRAARAPYSGGEVSLGDACSLSEQLAAGAGSQRYRIYGRYSYTKEILDTGNGACNPNGDKQAFQGERLMLEMNVY